MATIIFIQKLFLVDPYVGKTSSRSILCSIFGKIIIIFTGRKDVMLHTREEIINFYSIFMASAIERVVKHERNSVLEIIFFIVLRDLYQGRDMMKTTSKKL